MFRKYFHSLHKSTKKAERQTVQMFSNINFSANIKKSIDITGLVSFGQLAKNFKETNRLNPLI